VTNRSAPKNSSNRQSTFTPKTEGLAVVVPALNRPDLFEKSLGSLVSRILREVALDTPFAMTARRLA
jgi:hypothetical protein